MDPFVIHTGCRKSRLESPIIIIFPAPPGTSCQPIYLGGAAADDREEIAASPWLYTYIVKYRATNRGFHVNNPITVINHDQNEGFYVNNQITAINRDSVSGFCVNNWIASNNRDPI
jgi:hypothetical protein